MSATPLILLGRGGFGREVAAWIEARSMPFRVLGFLDDEKQADDVLGPIAGHRPRSDGASYLTCFGDGRPRRTLRERMESQGAHFATLVSPDVMTASPLHGSRNSIFLGACSISASVSLGDDLLVQGFAVIGHDVRIGNGVTVSSHAFVGGHATLEPFCTIHPHAVVLPGVTVGTGAVVGAGTVAIRNVPPHTTIFGMPGKVIAHDPSDA